MSARETWQSLQRHLSAARGFLEAGDHAQALAEADAALAIDSQFLAAQSLRERILAAGAHAAPACRSSPQLPLRTVAERDPLADFPLRPEAIPRPPAPAPETRPTKFQERATQRRVDRRLAAARAAIVERRRHDAAVALDKVLDLDPRTPELPALTAALGNLPRTPPAPRRGAWLVATLVFAAAMFGASWLEQNQHALVSRPSLAMNRIVAPPADTQPDAPLDAVAAAPPDAAPAADVDREPAAESPPAGTSGRTALSPPAPRSTMVAPASPPRSNPTTMVPADAGSLALPIVPPAPPVTTGPAPAVTTPAPPVTEPAPIPLAPQSLHAALPAAAAPSTRPPDAPEQPEVDDGAFVRQALDHYRRAYDGLDAGSAQAVWPAVDQGALARAFDGLESQTLTFDECRVQLHSEAGTATATCRGTTRYVPKVGSREPRTEPRVWNFLLRKRGSEWKIESARVVR